MPAKFIKITKPGVPDLFVHPRSFDMVYKAKGYSTSDAPTHGPDTQPVEVNPDPDHRVDEDADLNLDLSEGEV